MSAASPRDAQDSRAAIADVVYGYARNIREADSAACVALFCDDAVFEIRALAEGTRGVATTRARLEGRSAIERYLTQTEVVKASVCPMIHNLTIRIDGDAADSHSLMTTLVWPDGKQIVGEYHDRFRFDGRWRFASRQFTIFGAFAPR